MDELAGKLFPRTGRARPILIVGNSALASLEITPVMTLGGRMTAV